MTVYIYHNLSNCILKISEFIIGKLYVNKGGQKWLVNHHPSLYHRGEKRKTGSLQNPEQMSTLLILLFHVAGVEFSGSSYAVGDSYIYFPSKILCFESPLGAKVPCYTYPIGTVALLPLPGIWKASISPPETNLDAQLLQI